MEKHYVLRMKECHLPGLLEDLARLDRDKGQDHNVPASDAVRTAGFL